MVQGPPPTLAALVKFDTAWNGTPHRNFCVQLQNGRATIRVDGTPNYELYYVPKTYTQATETPDRIEIVTPDAPDGHATVCLGLGL
jgi:hypothetical protein